MLNGVYEPGDSFVSGGCEKGGDRFAEMLAKSWGTSLTIHYPRKEKLDSGLVKTNPRAAYAKINYARNTIIAEQCDVLVALVASDRSGGTEHTVKEARRLKKKVILLTK